MQVTRMHAGKITPAVAASVPKSPPTFVPTKVAALTAIGPGVISAMVTRSANSRTLSQPCRVTICS